MPDPTAPEPVDPRKAVVLTAIADWEAQQVPEGEDVDTYEAPGLVETVLGALDDHARATAPDDGRRRELIEIADRVQSGRDLVAGDAAIRGYNALSLALRDLRTLAAPVENESQRRVRLGIGDGLDHAVAGDGGRRRTVDMRAPDGSEDSWSDTPGDLVESAFGLICNVDGPAQGWTQNDEWVRAADRWCARYDRVIAAASSSEAGAIERLLVGELSVAFEVGRNWVPGGAAWDTQHHARRIAARLAIAPEGEGPGTSAVAAKVVEFTGGPLHDAERRVPITSGALPAAVVAPDADGRLTIYVLAYDDGEQPFYDYAGEPQGNEITRSARVLDDRSPAPASSVPTTDTGVSGYGAGCIAPACPVHSAPGVDPRGEDIEDFDRRARARMEPQAENADAASGGETRG